MAILDLGMAVTTIKSTYSLDPETVRSLEDLARRWKVSKSEALRRAIRSAAVGNADEADERLEAWTELQRSIDTTPAKARAWAARTRGERRASGRKRQGPAS